MKKDLTFKIAAIATSLVFVIATSLPLASATPSIIVSGTWTFDPPSVVISNWKFVGGNIQCDAYTTGLFLSGPIEGKFSQTLHVCYHYSDPKLVEQLKSQPPPAWPEAPFSYTRFVRHVTGTVLGRSGTFDMLLEWHGYGNTFKGFPGYDIEGKWVIVHGTGDLAGLHGQGTVWHTRTGPACFEYEGQIHFDP